MSSNTNIHSINNNNLFSPLIDLNNNSNTLEKKSTEQKIDLTEQKQAEYRQLIKPENSTGKFLYSKREILIYVKNRAIQKMEIDPKLEKTMKKIISRCERKLHELDKGNNVRIPTFYHATTQTASKSILGSSILPSEGIGGIGVYLSSEIELQYGSYIFAVDQEDIQKHPLADSLTNKKEKCFSGSNSTGKVWRALKEAYPVKVDKDIQIAYLVVVNESEIPEFEKLKKETGDFEIVTGEEAEEERKMLFELQGIYEPKSWNTQIKNESDSLSKLEFKVAPSSKEEVSSPEEDEAWK